MSRILIVNNTVLHYVMFDVITTLGELCKVLFFSTVCDFFVFFLLFCL